MSTTRKSSCVTARGVSPSAYPVPGACCLEEGEVGTPDLEPDWGIPLPRPGPGLGDGIP